MLVKEHQFKLYVGKKIHSICVEESISQDTRWREKFRATVPTAPFKSKEFYASTPEGAAEQAAMCLLRTNVHPIDLSLHQIQFRRETGTHDE